MDYGVPCLIKSVEMKMTVSSLATVHQASDKHSTIFMRFYIEVVLVPRLDRLASRGVSLTPTCDQDFCNPHTC